MQTTAIQPATNHTKSAPAQKSSLTHIHAWISTNTKPHQAAAAAAAIHKLKNRFLNASIELQLLSEWILLLKSQELENLYITSWKTSAINQMQHLSRRSSLHTSYYYLRHSSAYYTTTKTTTLQSSLALLLTTTTTTLGAVADADKNAVLMQLMI